MQRHGSALSFRNAGKDNFLLNSLNIEKSNSRMFKSMDSGTRFPDLGHDSVPHLYDFEHINFWVL